MLLLSVQYFSASDLPLRCGKPKGNFIVCPRAFNPDTATEPGVAFHLSVREADEGTLTEREFKTSQVNSQAAACPEAPGTPVIAFSASRGE